MQLEWIGHACFRITAGSGLTVVTDPYDESVGIRMLPLSADVITMSHDHHDHCETSQIVGEPLILRGQEEASRRGMTIRALASYHDDAEGAKRGANAIRIFEADGVKVVHMGDQGCMPDEEILAQIQGADALLIPVGGTYTVDAAGAKAIVERVKPRCVVPMHFKTQHCPYPIDTVAPFMALMGAGDAQPVKALAWTKEKPAGVVLMQPAGDEL